MRLLRSRFRFFLLHQSSLRRRLSSFLRHRRSSDPGRVSALSFEFSISGPSVAVIDATLGADFAFAGTGNATAGTDANRFHPLSSHSRSPRACPHTPHFRRWTFLRT